MVRVVKIGPGGGLFVSSKMVQQTIFGWRKSMGDHLNGHSWQKLCPLQIFAAWQKLSPFKYLLEDGPLWLAIHCCKSLVYYWRSNSVHTLLLLSVEGYIHTPPTIQYWSCMGVNLLRKKNRRLLRLCIVRCSSTMFTTLEILMEPCKNCLFILTSYYLYSSCSCEQSASSIRRLIKLIVHKLQA